MTRQCSRPLASASRSLQSRRIAAVAVSALACGVGVLSPAPARAADASLYVDGASTACIDAGPGTIATPFCTIGAAVNAAATGDTITVKRATYTERVDVGKTLTIVGESGATVDATDVLYGFKLSTAVQLSGFTVQSAVLADVFLSGATNATVRDVSTAGGANGVYVEGGSGNTVDRVDVTGASAVGILLRTTDDNTVSDSTTRNNQSHGLSIQGGYGNLVSGVTSVENFHGDRSATGIDVRGYTPFSTGILVPATHTTVEASTTSDNEDSGIEIYPDSSDTTARRNLTYANGDHGIDVAGAPNTAVVANTIVGNTNVGLNVEAAVTGGVGSTGTTVRDNISAENGIKPAAGGNGGEIRVDVASTEGTTLDRDLMWRSSPGQLLQFGTTFASDRASVLATGQEPNGLVADPKFASLSTRDLHLTLSSPAVDAAYADVAGWRDGDRDGNPPVDQLGVDDTGQGSKTYADIGAYELPAVAPPTAKLTATPAQLSTGGTSTLDASGSAATAPNATLTGYAFDCGDGSTASSTGTATVTCTYAKAGKFTASVTVTDSNKLTATAHATVTVTDPVPPPTAKLTATPAQLSTGGTSTLDASGSAATAPNATLTGYAFDCGDGSTASSTGTATVTCTYAKAGKFTASVTVTDSNKLTATAHATVTVTDPVPPPPPPPGPAPGPGPLPSPSAPEAQLTATPTHLLAGGTSDLDGSGSKATVSGITVTGYRFDCGNGVAAASGPVTSAKCTYLQAGSYTARLAVTDSQGMTGTASVTITVTAQAEAPAAPHARMRLVSTRLANRHLRVRTDAAASTGSPRPLVAYKFYCGNGHHTTWLHRTSANCVYSHHGRYHVRVRVKDSLGAVDTVARTIRFRR